MAKDTKDTLSAEPKNKLAAASWGTVNIGLLDCEGKPLVLSSGSKVCGRMRVLGQCKQLEDTCWQELTANETGKSPWWRLTNVPLNRTMVIEAQATQQSDQADGNVMKFTHALVNFDCGPTTQTVSMRQLPGLSPLQKESVTLALRAHRCGRDGQHERGDVARFAWATAEPADPDQSTQSKSSENGPSKSSPIRANIIDGAAFLQLKKGGYLIDGELEERCARTCPSMPVYYCVERDEELSICAESRERSLTLLVKDSCGNSFTKPTDIFWEQDGNLQPLPSCQAEGTYLLNGIARGRLRLVSASLSLSHHEFEVHEDDWNLAHVVTVLRERPALTSSAGLDQLVLDLGREIKKGEHVLFRILTLEGELIKTIEAGNGKTEYFANQDQAIMIHAVVDGNVVGEQMHNPRQMPQGKR
jgi:hypothetical protein